MSTHSPLVYLGPGFPAMAIESSPRASQRTVYVLLVALGLLAAAVAGSTIGFIAYEYTTRPELRNPIPLEAEGEHSAVPAWVAGV